MKNVPAKTLERKLFKQGYRYVCGVDEVGMGCLAGPAVVCAVLLGPDFYATPHPELSSIKESKLLSPAQREKFAGELLKNKNCKFKICLASVQSIDKLNIYQAVRGAMRAAVQDVTNTKTMILVDGKHKITGLSHDQQAIVKGDRKIFAIACASIIAKVHRDRLMAKMARRYPGYGFEKHKGYGTRYHLAQLAKLGPSIIHRKSFAPVAKLSYSGEI